jgi:hypothetical protein
MLGGWEGAGSADGIRWQLANMRRSLHGLSRHSNVVAAAESARPDDPLSFALYKREDR